MAKSAYDLSSMASELLDTAALAFKRGNFHWLEAIAELRSQITSISSKARNKETRMVYSIGVMPDEDQQPAEVEQSVYLHTIEKLFEYLESEKAIKQCEFVQHQVPSEIDIGPPNNLLEAHFSCIPFKLGERLRKLQQDLEDRIGRKIRIDDVVARLRLEPDCLQWGEFKVPLESYVQRKIGTLLFENRDEKCGEQSIRKGTPIALKNEAELLKSKFPDAIKYFRRKIRENFVANNLKISVSNPSRGEGKYIMMIQYPR